MTGLVDLPRLDLSERDFTAQVIELARLLGWRTAHFRPAWTGRGWRTPVQGDGAGFPDLILARGDRLIAVELKAGRGKPTPEQLAWLHALAEAGVTTAVWRPADFDLVVKVLQA
jgi:hypothetical protein